jgi:2-polyprenyl-3-methyl-5-hydroxy-6-metoxy-1,4-benzoquinol methylase
MGATYNPAIFDVPNLEWAKDVILTVEAGVSTEDRWATETPYVADLIGEALRPTQESLILDYGCGVGRLARELIHRHGCTVIGVDISASMRRLSADYVDSDRFMACAPATLGALTGAGLRFDGAISIWVLQHCLEPDSDLAAIHAALKPRGGLFLVNNSFRVVPTVEHDWVNDGVDVEALIAERFTRKARGALSADHVAENLARNAFWAAYEARPRTRTRNP